MSLTNFVTFFLKRKFLVLTIFSSAFSPTERFETSRVHEASSAYAAAQEAAAQDEA
jgi:hypothetical protein